MLKKPSIKIIAIANPSVAPYGVAAMEAVKNAGIYDKIKNKIVYGESIAQVDQYLLSGVANMVITAKSVVKSPDLKNKGKWTEVPVNLYRPIKQGAVLLKHAKDNGLKAAKAFYRFLFSAPGKRIIKSFGYKIR